MKYSFNSRVRYSETDEEGKLSLPGVLNYFQDCSTFQSEEIHQGIAVMKERKKIWVLSSWQVIVNRYPDLGEEIRITTWAYAFRGFMGSRNYTLETLTGERLAYANSLWSCIDMNTGIPVRLKEEDIKGYDPEEKLDMEYAPRKIKMPEVAETYPKIEITQEHLDTNHHVNNVQYIILAEHCLPENFQIAEIQAEYKMQTRLGDTLIPRAAKVENEYIISLDDENEHTHAVVKFIEK